MSPRQRELLVHCMSAGTREWPGSRDSGEVAVLGRLLPGRVWRERGPADTGRLAVDSARVVAVERWADDAPRWVREVVRRDGGRLLVVRQRPANPECEPRLTAAEWWRADGENAPFGTEAVFEVQLVPDTLDGRPRVLGVVGTTTRWAWRPGLPAGQRSIFADRAAPQPTAARWLAWWPILGALGEGRHPWGTERDTTLVGDTVVARRVVAWAEAHRDSAAADPVIGLVMRARRLLEDHARMALRSVLEGRWTATMTTPEGLQFTLALHAGVARGRDGVPRVAGLAEALDDSDSVMRPRREAAVTEGRPHPLGPPGWRPDITPHAYELSLTAGDGACADDLLLRGRPQACVAARGRLVHDAAPSHADPDSAVYAAAIDLSGVGPLLDRFRTEVSMLERLPQDQQVALVTARLEANEQLPRALLFSTRQGRCVVYHRTGAARCSHRGLSGFPGEVIQYDLRRAPDSARP